VQVNQTGEEPEAPVPAARPPPPSLLLCSSRSVTTIGITGAGYGALPPDEPVFFNSAVMTVAVLCHPTAFGRASRAACSRTLSTRRA
jgi:hypothetical protein